MAASGREMMWQKSRSNHDGIPSGSVALFAFTLNNLSFINGYGMIVGDYSHVLLKDWVGAISSLGRSSDTERNDSLITSASWSKSPPQ